jgi:phospholipid/cholesterol/gamma-HCH transport system ATP-binding protein
MNIENTQLLNHNTFNSLSNDPVINITNVAKAFAGVPVLQDISIQLFKGENLVVLGKSGTGKSVLIKCIAGLLRHDKGTIDVFGKDIKTMRAREIDEYRLKLGFLFQSGALYDSMTVKQNLEFPLIRSGKKLSRHEMNNKINEVLENVGLPEVINKMPSELSGGMRKRISLARTIIVDPLIMLYDEPTTGLDPVTSDEISTLINDVRMKYKTSSIIITHDIKCALKTANRIVMLHEGTLYQEGNVDDFESSTDPMIHSFFH